MERPIKLIVDCSTNTTTEVELTDEEIAQREALQVEAAAAKAAADEAEALRVAAKASAEAKLLALGLTAEEIAAL
jgi:hypothetical protein